MPESKITIALNGVPELSGKNFPLVAPEGVQAPFAVFCKNEGKEYSELSSGGGLHKALYRVDILADEYGTIKKIASDVSLALLNIEDGSAIQAVFVDENQAEGYEPSVNLMRKSINFKIIYAN